MYTGRLAASMHLIHPEEIMARQDQRATETATRARETDSEVNKTMLARKVLIERRKEEHERAREEAEKEEELKKRAEQVGLPAFIEQAIPSPLRVNLCTSACPNTAMGIALLLCCTSQSALLVARC
jgi:hypothetical protein